MAVMSSEPWLPSSEASLLHYTIGGPYFNEYRDCDHAQDWWDEHYLMNTCVQRTQA